MKEKIEILQKLIYEYQLFIRWILRYNKDIEQSERGKEFLNRIDAYEQEVREIESLASKIRK
jgi:hypothetical protein